MTHTTPTTQSVQRSCLVGCCTNHPTQLTTAADLPDLPELPELSELCDLSDHIQELCN